MQNIVCMQVSVPMHVVLHMTMHANVQDTYMYMQTVYLHTCMHIHTLLHKIRCTHVYCAY